MRKHFFLFLFQLWWRSTKWYSHSNRSILKSRAKAVCFLACVFISATVLQVWHEAGCFFSWVFPQIKPPLNFNSGSDYKGVLNRNTQLSARTWEAFVKLLFLDAAVVGPPTVGLLQSAVFAADRVGGGGGEVGRWGGGSVTFCHRSQWLLRNIMSSMPKRVGWMCWSGNGITYDPTGVHVGWCQSHIVIIRSLTWAGLFS